MRQLLASVTFLSATIVAAGDPLFDAVSQGNVSAVEVSIDAGADVNSRARDKATPLISAALSNQLAIVELLLSKDADVMARNSGGFTSLHAAAYSGSVPISKLLLEHGATLEDAANKAGVTPLMVAGEENHVALVEFLLANGADPSHAEAHGYAPITRALWKGNFDVVRVLKQHGVACPPATILGGDENYAKCVGTHE